MSAPLSPAVQVRTEALRRVLSTTLTHSWEFSCWEDAPDDEPRIRDTDAATQLGYAQPRDVRKLIERIWPENQRPNCRATVSRQPVGPGGKGTREYKVSEYWLTEAQLLKLIARSETPVAESILDEMIAVYMAVRRHIAATVAVRAHERNIPRALPAPAVVKTPESRQLPPPPETVLRLRDLPNWPLLRQIAESTAPHRIDSRYYDLAGEFAVPKSTPTYPAVIADLAFFALRHTPPVLLPTR